MFKNSSYPEGCNYSFREEDAEPNEKSSLQANQARNPVL